MTTHTPRSTLPPGRLVAGMLLYVIVGTPLVAVVWEGANHLLQGRIDRGDALAIPAAALLAGLLYLMQRTIRGWEGERRDRIAA